MSAGTPPLRQSNAANYEKEGVIREKKTLKVNPTRKVQAQVQVQLRRGRQSTPRNHETRRNVVCTVVHHCTMARVTWFRSFTVPLFTATMELRRKQWEERFGRQLPEGGPEPRAEGAPKARAAGAPPSEQGISVPASPFCFSILGQLCIFWTALVCPFFSSVHLFVCFFSKKGCGGAHPEDERAAGSKGAC